MFETLTDRLNESFARLGKKGRLTEQDVDDAMREVRRALLEADVNFKVAKDFVAAVRERAVGQDVLHSLTPAQTVIGIANEELIRVLGEEGQGLIPPDRPPQILMLVGLQGSGKTTHAAKLAVHQRKQGRNHLLVAADVYRTDAINQLQALGKQIRILGMGDILSLIERAQETTTEEDAVELQERMLKGQFNLEDFLEQLQKVKQMGPLSQLLEMIPGLGAQMRQAKAQIYDDYKRVEAIIYSMTPDERRNPDVIGRRRTARIATGSGTSIQEVKQLLKQFDEMQKMMSQMGRMAKKGKMPPGLPFNFG